MKETQTHYGVRLTRETDGVHYLAVGREHGLEGKVVRVTAEYIFG